MADNFNDTEIEDDDEEQDESELEEEYLEDLELETNANESAKNLSLKNQLTELRKKLRGRLLPVLSPSEKHLVSKGRRKYPNLVKRINSSLKAKQDRLKFFLSILGTIVVVALGLFIVIFLAVAIGAWFDSMFSWLYGGDDSKGISSDTPIMTGANYYGLRAIFRDEEQARADLINQYVDIVDNAIDSVEAGAQDYSLTINIDLPVEYDFASFEELTFASEYPELYTIIAGNGTTNGIVDIVYLNDNPQGTAVELYEQLDAIMYFGLSSELNSEVANLLINYINSNDLYSINSESSGMDNSQIETNIENSINQYFTNASTVRTEKLYIRDYIFSGSDKGINNLVRENYISAIYMPLTNVSVSDFEIVLGGENIDLSTFAITVSDGTNSAIMSAELLDDSDGKGVYYFKAKNMTFSSNKYENIDEDNLSYLANGKSIYNIFTESSESGVDYNIYLQEKSNTENENIKYLTFKDNGGIKLDFSGDFNFAFADSKN